MNRKEFDKHVTEGHADLQARLVILEKGHELSQDTRRRVQDLESKVSDMTDKVKALSDTLVSFTEEVRIEFRVFSKDVVRTNTGFVRWLVGTVLVGFLLGVFGQYTAFHQVHKSIGELDKDLMELEMKLMKK